MFILLYYSILVGASIAWTKSAESASHPAVSSQSYNRGDIPLSYGHNIVHGYTNSAPHKYSNNKQRNQRHDTQPRIKNYHDIQYAPLPMNIPERDNRNEDAITEAEMTAYSEKVNGVYNTKLGSEQKAHLEPQFISTTTPNYYKRLNPYAHGYNTNEETLSNEMFQPKSYSYDANAPERKKQILVNYFQPPITYHNTEHVQTTEAVVRKQYPNCNPVLPSPTHQNQDLNKYNPNVLAGKENIDPVKVSKVPVNVARTLSIARPQRKATINFNFRKIPSLPHNFFIFQNSQISKSRIKSKYKRDKNVNID